MLYIWYYVTISMEAPNSKVKRYWELHSEVLYLKNLGKIRMMNMVWGKIQRYQVNFVDKITQYCPRYYSSEAVYVPLFQVFRHIFNKKVVHSSTLTRSTIGRKLSLTRKVIAIYIQWALYTTAICGKSLKPPPKTMNININKIMGKRKPRQKCSTL